jgi:hypothetical protein
MVKIWDGAVAKLKSACLECARSWVWSLALQKPNNNKNNDENYGKVSQKWSWETLSSIVGEERLLGTSKVGLHWGRTEL